MCTDGDVRLVGGSSTTEGILQFCYNSVWGAVCGDDFDSAAATVVCNQLGISKFGMIKLEILAAVGVEFSNLLRPHYHAFCQEFRSYFMTIKMKMSIGFLVLTPLDAQERKVDLLTALLFPSETHSRGTVVYAIFPLVCSV